MEYLIISFRTLIFYILIITIYRFMGKREIGELGIVDLIVSILIAEFAAISIENWNDPILFSIIPIIILTLIEVILAYFSLKSSKLRTTIEGRPSIIIKKGNLDFKEMASQRYNLDDLLAGLRQQNIRTIEDVDYAILEENGVLSVFKKSDKRVGEYPLPLIMDGNINKDTLKNLKKKEIWLEEYLNERNIKLSDIFYAFYDKEKIYIIKK